MEDLRAEVRDRGEDAGWVDALITGWRGAALGAGDRALCSFAEKLTLDPAAMREADVGALRQEGFDDVSIHDAIQVVAYFNYINRIADAIHVDLEPGMPPYPESTSS